MCECCKVNQINQSTSDKSLEENCACDNEDEDSDGWMDPAGGWHPDIEPGLGYDPASMYE